MQKGEKKKKKELNQFYETIEDVRQGIRQEKP